MSTADSEWAEWLVGKVDTLKHEAQRGFVVGDDEWPFRGFVVRAGGQLHAYANICPHRRHPLDSMPERFLVEDGRLIRCGSHGALFEPDTGKCVFGPCMGQQLMKLRLRINDAGEVLVSAPDSLQDALALIHYGERNPGAN